MSICLDRKYTLWDDEMQYAILYQAVQGSDSVGNLIENI